MFNEANNQTFQQLIDNEKWTAITEDMDSQTAYGKFEEIYLKHYETAYPLKIITLVVKMNVKIPNLGF